MSDSLEIESLFTKSNVLEADCYEKVEYVQLYDQQQGNYSQGQIQFLTDSLMKSQVVLSESFLVLPIQATMGTDARITVKNSILSFIQGLSIESGSGTTICNEQQSTPIVANLRLLLDSSLDFVEGNELCYTGKSRWVETDPSGQGLSVVGSVPQQASTGNGVPASFLDTRFNPALSERITVFTNRTKHTTAVTGPPAVQATRVFTAYIPLKFIHDFFAKMDFPCANLSLRMTFNISGITGGVGQGFCPWVTPLYPAHSTLGLSGGPADSAPGPGLVTAVVASGAPAPLSTGQLSAALPAAAAPLPAVTIAGTLQAAVATPVIASTTIPAGQSDEYGVAVAPRIYVKTVYFRAKEAERLQELIKKGESKELVYTCSNYYYQAQAGGIGINFQWPFVQGIIRPVRMWVFPLASGTMAASTNDFPASIGSYYLQNMNLLLNGNNFYNNRFQTQYDFYKEFKTQLLGASSSKACATPISYSDWVAGCNPYVFDLSRNPTVKSDNLCTLTLQTDIKDQVTGAAPAAGWDLWIVVERLQTLTMKISEAGIEMVTKQGAPSS
jgi:hypothetical protein